MQRVERIGILCWPLIRRPARRCGSTRLFAALFAAGVLSTGGGIVFAATAAGDLGRSRFWIGQAALVFPNRSYDRFFSNKRFGRRKAVRGDCPAAGAQRCTEQVEYFHHPSSPLTAIVAQFKLPLSIC